MFAINNIYDLIAKKIIAISYSLIRKFTNVKNDTDGLNR